MEARQHTNTNTQKGHNMTRNTRITTGCTLRNRKATVECLPMSKRQAVPASPTGDALFVVAQSDSVDSVLTALVNTVIG